MTKEKLIEMIGYSFALVVSGNNQPHMSGDPRMRIPPIKRRHFDDACDALADKLLAELSPPPQAPAVANDVREALKSLVDVVSSMRVPQTMADAALQVMTIGPALKRARKVLAQAPPSNEGTGND